jgi:hypothetical protein
MAKVPSTYSKPEVSPNELSLSQTSGFVKYMIAKLNILLDDSRHILVQKSIRHP